MVEALQKIGDVMEPLHVHFDKGLTFRPLLSEEVYRTIRTHTKMRSIACDRTHHIVFCRGSYDNWAAAVIRTDTELIAEIAYPKDEYYFDGLLILAERYGHKKVFDDVEVIYFMVEDDVRQDHLQLLARFAKDYGLDEDLAYDMFLHIYYGMIAEEHYQRRWSHNPHTSQKTLVGKLMKLHGLRRLLIERIDLEVACRECVNVLPSVILWRMEQWGYIREVPRYAYSHWYDAFERQPIVESGSKKTW